MAYLNSFTVLQQRSASLTHVALCSAMDLIAMATEDSLSLHRTITWERVYHEKFDEAFQGKVISALAFSCVGKCLSIGFSDGTVAILDVETADVLPARYRGNSQYGAVLSFAWQKISYGEASDTAKDRSWLFGGLNQIQRGGMAEYSDPTASNLTSSASDGISVALTSPVPARRELVMLLAGHVHLSLTADGSVHGHVVGVFPLFRMQIFSATNSSTRLVSGGYAGASVLCSSAQGVVELPFTQQFTREVKWLEHGASLYLCIESNLARLQELVLGCGRKWKDSCKVVLPKLSLLQTLLDSYELRMTPIEFCYSVAVCGLWHPAAATAFSQHWNDQGLQRLRAGVDATSRSVIKLLQTKALPMATNCLLAARELLAVLEHLQHTRADTSFSAAAGADVVAGKQLVQLVERVIVKIDEALLEARLARDAMLLYIQFIKDCTYDVAATENTATMPGVKPDIVLRSKYQAIFDPRSRRAPSKGPAAQAEHVTGSHLFEYLQDASATAGSAAGSVAACEGGVYEAAAAIADNNLNQALSIHAESTGDSPKCTPSILYELKAAKEIAHGLFLSPHAHTSVLLQSSVAGLAAPAALGIPPVPPSAKFPIAQASQTLSQLTVKCGDDETTLAQALLLAVTHRGRICIIVKALGSDESGEGEDEVGNGGTVHCAALSIPSMLRNLVDGGEGGSSKSADISQVRAVTLAIYSKAGSGEDSSEVSVLVGLEIGAGVCEGVFVCKLPLEDVDFTETPDDTHSDATLVSVSAQDSPEEFKSRKIGLKNIASLNATGERGVALVADAAGKIVVLDVEGEEETEGGSSDGDEDDEEGGGGDATADQSDNSMDQSC